MGSPRTRAIGAVLVAAALLACSTPGWSWDPVEDLTGRSVDEHVERATQRLERAGRQFLHNPVEYTLSRPMSLLSDICSQGPMHYEGTLAGQASGRWLGIPPPLANALQPHYAVDLRKVQYATNIRTANGQAQTFGRSIYFPSPLNLSQPADMRWLLHELEHASQFENASYGQRGKLCEYMAHYVASGFRHDDVGMERAADRKADHLLPLAMNALPSRRPPPIRPQGLWPNQIWVRNETAHPVQFLLQTQTISAPVVLGAYSHSVYTGHPNNRWFNIEVWSNPNYRVRYSLNGGTRQHIAINRDGMLDVFWSH